MSASDSSSRPALLVIARGDQELGSWPESEVRRGLGDGRLQSSDYFWREGMGEWLPLTELIDSQSPPPPPAQPLVFAIRFGSARAVDQFGFVRHGEISFFADSIELRGNRHWPKAARFGLGLIAWVILAMTFSALGDAFPHEAGLIVHSLAVMNGLMVWLGAPFLAMMLTHYFCASPGRLSLAKSKLTGIVRRGIQISFTAPAADSGKPVSALFRAENEAAALTIEKQLHST